MANIRQILILELLKEETDYEHPLTINEIQKKLFSIYREEVRKKDTIKLLMDELLDFYSPERLDDKGIWILDRFNDDSYQNKHAYYVHRTDLEEGEIISLYYAALESKVYTKEVSANICEKLAKYMSKNAKIALKDGLQEDGKAKTENKEVILNIEKIHETILEKGFISFQYLHYNLQKKLVLRAGKKKIEVKPLAITHSDGKNYLLAYNVYYKELRVYRIDKMINIEKLIKPSVEVEPKNIKKINMQGLVFMHMDNQINVELRCEMRILDNVIEQFNKCKILPDPDSQQHFIAKISEVSNIGIRYWALEFLSTCEVLSPPELRQDLKNTLETSLGLYNR